MQSRDEQVAALEQEIEAFRLMSAELEANHMGKFVVIKDGKLQGSYDTVENAAAFARARFGAGPYLIRQVGITFGPLPASVMYRPVAVA